MGFPKLETVYKPPVHWKAASLKSPEISWKTVKKAGRLKDNLIWAANWPTEVAKYKRKARNIALKQLRSSPIKNKVKPEQLAGSDVNLFKILDDVGLCTMRISIE